MVIVVDRQWFVISFAFIKEYSDLKTIKNVQIRHRGGHGQLKAINHTDNIDSVTLGNIETKFCLGETVYEWL